MSIDISSLLSVSNNSLYGSSSNNAHATGTDFTSVLLNTLSSKTTGSKENPLYTALTSATKSDLYAPGITNPYTDYLSQYKGSAGNIEGYLSNYANNRTSSQQLGDSLMANLQSKMLGTLTVAKKRLTDNAAAYSEKVGTEPSEATKIRLEQMQKNVSLLDDFIAKKKSDMSLLQPLQQQSSLNQYLLSQNKTSLF